MRVEMRKTTNGTGGYNWSCKVVAPTWTFTATGFNPCLANPLAVAPWIIPSGTGAGKVMWFEMDSPP
jgi:hypothetical protein